jgi:pyrroloquinoline-quinone synthase
MSHRASSEHLVPAILPIVAALDAAVAARHLLDHPFYQAWSRGELSVAALRDYAAQYYQHVAAFPTYLSAVHAQTDDPAVRRHILENLIDEEAGSPNHPELWLQFAEGLGLGREQVRQTAPWPATKKLIADFRSCCRERGTAAGLAALYAYESQIPAVCATKIEGLKAHYGFTDPGGYEYFTVHIEADREHAAVEAARLAQLVDDSQREAALASAGEVLAGLYGLLSAVCDRHGIADCTAVN